MGCGDVRLLKTIGSVDFTGQERAALNKLTMPVQTLVGHSQPQTTALYDRRERRIARSVVEQISI